MKITRFLAATFAVACLATVSVLAAASSAVGTWSWSQPGRDADITVSATFETKAGQLTGTLTNPMATVDITELVVKGDDISFEVAGRRGGATKYAGKIAGDTITGIIEVPARGGGEAKKVDWKAKRTSPPAK